jgi:hypothetical protein
VAEPSAAYALRKSAAKRAGKPQPKKKVSRRG